MAMHATAAIPRHSSRFQRFYVTLWACLAALALGYMTLLLVAPDWIGTSAVVQAESEQEAASDQEIVAAPAEGADASQTAAVEGDEAQSETSTAAAEEQDNPAAEQFASPAPPAAEEPANPEPPAAAAPAESAAAEAPPPVVFEFPTATGPKIVILNGPAASSITTGSLPAAPAQPIEFGPAIVKPAPPPVALQLGSGSSLDALQLSWSLLSDQHHSVLQNLEPRYQTAGSGQALTYKLIAGPIATVAEAKRACALLRAKKVTCGVGPFGGEAL